MANTTSSAPRRQRKSKRSFKPDPKKLRPLRYKTEMGLAFERLAARMGMTGADAPTRLDATWEGTR